MDLSVATIFFPLKICKKKKPLGICCILCTILGFIHEFFEWYFAFDGGSFFFFGRLVTHGILAHGFLILVKELRL
jgi:hypothetical protein